MQQFVTFKILKEFRYGAQKYIAARTHSPLTTHESAGNERGQ